ncbi:MAG: hypothetical protein ACXWO3_07720, partial [Isosphaeraceae bacterium]
FRPTQSIGCIAKECSTAPAVSPRSAFLPSISWAPAKAVGIGSPMSPVERAGNHESPGVASSIASATKVNDALSGQEDRMHAMCCRKKGKRCAVVPHLIILPLILVISLI